MTIIRSFSVRATFVRIVDGFEYQYVRLAEVRIGGGKLEAALEAGRLIPYAVAGQEIGTLRRVVVREKRERKPRER